MEWWLDAAAFLVRWLHVIAAIAWIGESFYFVALDRGLKSPSQSLPGLFGDSWSVHGGGFYLKQKYLPAPAELPLDLHWSKWKSYTTWLSGFALLCLVYFTQAQFLLVDARVLPMSTGKAVALVLMVLVLSWLVYDLMCRWFADNDWALGAALILFTVLLVKALSEVFAMRATILLSGAVLGSIMSANVFFLIIPGQKRLVAALREGVAPNPLDGARGKQRSVHNTWFTLPVVFAMVATHYPPLYGHAHAWLLLLGFMAAGVLIRWFFVAWHSGQRLWLLWALIAALIGAAFAVMAPRSAGSKTETSASEQETASADSRGTGGEIDFASAALDDTLALQMVKRHCAACHAAHSQLFPAPPKGVILETTGQLREHAPRIRMLSVQSQAMPPGNLSQMSDAERAWLGRWLDSPAQ
jgi:uncharacterized membrane protein